MFTVKYKASVGHCVVICITNLCYESQNHLFAMHIIALFFPIFWKISRSSDVKKRVGGEEEEGQEAGAEGGVEVDEER